MKENAVLIGMSAKTIRKYLRKEGIVHSDNTTTDNYQKFLSVYLIEDNQKISLRKLAEKCGISKSQVGRYIKTIKSN